FTSTRGILRFSCGTRGTPRPFRVSGKQQISCSEGVKQPMKACVDVDYRDGHAIAACVLFRDWSDAKPAETIALRIEGVAPYVPGEFYKRELPCLLAVLEKVAEPAELVIVDGYVWLAEDDRPGLGAHLYTALKERIPVIGVAKTRFASARRAVAVVRGENATR